MLGASLHPTTEANMANERLALVIGAAGGVGFESARALIRHGWRVRALARDPSRAPNLPGAQWVRGDAMDRADVLAASSGASVVVHAVNPPGYKNWPKLVLPMLANTIAAAEMSGARVVLPGTIYNYGPDAFPLLREDDPQQPLTRKGKIRVAMERALEAAAARGVKTLILRGGDFFGPHGNSSWFSQAMVQADAPLKRVIYPGKRDVGHAFVYLPDFAETIAQLLARESDLAMFERFHFRGHAFARGIEFAERTRLAAGAPSAPIHGFPWPVVVALAPFVALFREMAEMRYLWNRDVQLDNAKLVAFLGAEPHTPIDAALRASLTALNVRPRDLSASAEEAFAPGRAR
jgi:nucleoside-diphosphate-sugar epimerase